MYRRAERLSATKGSGKFITLVDLHEFSRNKCPPKAAIFDTIGLLKKHYPDRLGGIYIVNGGATFNFLWRLLKPVIPRRAIEKTFVLTKKQYPQALNDALGRDNFELAYGGGVAEEGEGIRNVGAYFSQGYWHSSNSYNRREKGKTGGLTTSHLLDQNSGKTRLLSSTDSN
jgi:hypothetical protein